MRMPNSAVRQNLLFDIESLARRVSQVESAQNGKLSDEASRFFEKLYRDLENCKKMVVAKLLLPRVYIYQKLFEIGRDLFQYSPPSDCEHQFLFIRRALKSEFDLMSDADKAAFEGLEKEITRMQKEGGEKRLSVSSLGTILYFSRLEHDKVILTIWNSERLATTSRRLGTLLSIGAIASTCLAALLFDVHEEAGHYIYSLNTLRLVSAVVGGMTGGCISAIATSRTTRDENGEKVIPLINIDWMRPILGAAAGLIFGLIVTGGVGNVTPSFVIAGSIAFGFSEQVLYSVLKKRADQLERELANQVNQGKSKAKKGGNIAR
jgi:hypothetical protein